MKSSSNGACQELAGEEVSEISSQASSKNNEPCNSSSGKVSLDLSLTVAAAAAGAPSATESSTTDSGGTRSVATAAAAREPARMFTCNYCQRKFFSWHALGGHQNSHRRERTLVRRAVRLDTFPYGYVDVASLPHRHPGARVGAPPGLGGGGGGACRARRAEVVGAWAARPNAVLRAGSRRRRGQLRMAEQLQASTHQRHHPHHHPGRQLGRQLRLLQPRRQRRRAGRRRARPHT